MSKLWLDWAFAQVKTGLIGREQQHRSPSEGSKEAKNANDVKVFLFLKVFQLQVLKYFSQNIDILFLYGYLRNI